MKSKDRNPRSERTVNARLLSEIANGATSDKAVRAKAYSAAIKIITEQAYWLPINTYVNAYAFAKDLDFKTYPDELPRFYYAKWK